MSPKKKPAAPPASRVESLTDGIFAFAMTLLVLNLTLPDQLDPTSEVLSRLLTGQAKNFYTYVLSFLLLGNLWATHHRQHHFIIRTDIQHVWIHIIMLMFVALVPFSTTLLSDFSTTVLADVLFDLNLLVLGVLFLINWMHATHNHRLVDPDLDPAVISEMRTRNLILPSVSVLALILSFFLPGYSSYLFLLVPLLYWGPFFRH